MGIANDIEKLGEDVVASYDGRVKAIGVLVKDTRQMLKRFRADREEMSDNQAKVLANFVADLTKNVGSMIKDFQNEHKAMAEELRASLDKGEADRLKDFKAMMSGIQKTIKEIEIYVRNKLKEFSDAHMEMSGELKEELAKYVGDIVSATKELLDGFKGEREDMAANWQNLVETMAKKRDSKSKVEAEVKMRPVKEAIEEIESIEEEEMKEVEEEEEVKPKKKGRSKGKGKKK